MNNSNVIVVNANKSSQNEGRIIKVQNGVSYVDKPEIKKIQNNAKFTKAQNLENQNKKKRIFYFRNCKSKAEFYQQQQKEMKIMINSNITLLFY